jgi:hypothetical protein
MVCRSISSKGLKTREDWSTLQGGTRQSLAARAEKKQHEEVRVGHTWRSWYFLRGLLAHCQYGAGLQDPVCMPRPKMIWNLPTF